MRYLLVGFWLVSSCCLPGMTSEDVLCAESCCFLGQSQGAQQEYKIVELIDVNGVQCAVTRGRATWSQSAQARLNRMAEWAARLDAESLARARMVEFLSGSDIEGQRWLRERAKVSDSEASEGAETATQQAEAIKRAVAGVLANLKADVQSSNGTLTLQLTATAQSYECEVGLFDIEAPTLAVGVSWLLELARQGRLPPSAGVEIVAGDGCFHVGIGGALAGVDGAGRIASLTQAEESARAGLLAHLKGEKVQIGERSHSQFSEYLSGEQSAIKSNSRMERRTELLVKGRLPAGVRKLERVDADGITYALVVLAPFGLPDDPKESQPIPLPSDPSERIVDVSGEGTTPREALTRALADAVMQVWGGGINRSRRTKTVFKDAMTDLNGDFNSRTTSEFKVNEELTTETRGMIKRYSVLKKWRDLRAGTFSIKIRVTVPVFDPDDPRPGKRPVVGVMPFRKSLHGIQGVDSVDVISKVEAHSVEKLVATQQVTILDQTYLDEIDNAQRQWRQRFKDGQMQATELAKIGHLMGADYLLVGTLHRFQRSNRRVNAASGTRLSVVDVDAKLSCRLMNVATSELVVAPTFEGRWDTSDELDYRHEHRSEPSKSRLDVSGIVLHFASDHIASEVTKALIEHRERLRHDRLVASPPVIAAVDQAMVILDARAVAHYLRLDDLLEATRVKSIPMPGRSPLIARVPVALIKIVRIDGSVAFAEFVSGNRLAMMNGMPCPPKAR